MFDEVHAEAVVVFDLHAIEDATVRINSDEKTRVAVQNRITLVVVRIP